MAKYRDLPGRKALPGALFPENAVEKRKGLHPVTKVFIGLFLFFALLMLGIMARERAMYMFVHYHWVMPILASLCGVCLAVLLMLGLRRLGRTRWSKLGLTSVGIIIVAFVIAFGASFCYTIYDFAERPVAYLDAPNDETVVVMRSFNTERDPSLQGGYTVQYTAYQMLGQFFYLSLGEYNCPPVYSTSELEPEWAVEWLENGDMRLYLPEYETLPHGQTYLTIYDMYDLEASIEAKGIGTYVANATPEPDPTPTPIPTVAPTVDPFAY